MESRRMLMRLGQIVWGLGFILVTSLAWFQAWSIMIVSLILVSWFFFGMASWIFTRRLIHRRLRVLRQERRIRVEGERISVEEDGKLLLVHRSDVLKISEWPKHGIVIDTHARRGAVTIPKDSKNYYELRNALLNWDSLFLDMSGTS